MFINELLFAETFSIIAGLASAVMDRRLINEQG